MPQLFHSLHYPFQLPNLPYDYSALEPHIDAQTMEVHHSKHHQAYVNNLNKALENHPDLHAKSLADLLSDAQSLPTDIRQPVINHGGGHANHTLFWQIMEPVSRHSEATTNSSSTVAEESPPNLPTGPLSQAINQAFSSFPNFQEEFSQTATTIFGSGWAWLVVSPDNTLQILTTPNQDSPLSQNLTPILTLDVWEHAYYLKYQNRRPDYIAAWWNVVDWEKVGEFFQEANR